MMHLSKRIAARDTRFTKNLASSEVDISISSGIVFPPLFLCHAMRLTPGPHILSMAGPTISLSKSIVPRGAVATYPFMHKNIISLKQ